MLSPEGQTLDVIAGLEDSEVFRPLVAQPRSDISSNSSGITRARSAEIVEGNLFILCILIHLKIAHPETP